MQSFIWLFWVTLISSAGWGIKTNVVLLKSQMSIAKFKMQQKENSKSEVYCSIMYTTLVETGAKLKLKISPHQFMAILL